MSFVRNIRVMSFLVFIAASFITAVLVQHIRRLRAFSSFERQLEAEEILPFAEDISLFYSYPRIRPHSIREKRQERLLLALSKRQTIPLLSSKDYDLDALPYRNDEGVYAFRIEQDDSLKSGDSIEIFYTLSDDADYGYKQIFAYVAHGEIQYVGSHGAYVREER